MSILLLNPSPEALEAFLASSQPCSDVDLFRLVTDLLKYTVPQVYLSVPDSTQIAIAHVFRSLVGLGNLTGQIRLHVKTESPNRGALQPLVLLLHRVLQPGLLPTLVGGSPAVKKEVEKLLYRGTLYSVVREAAVVCPDLVVPPQLSGMDSYLAYLTIETTQLQNGQQFLPLLLSHDSPAVFEVLFDRKNLDILAGSHLKRYERKQLLFKFLDYIQLRLRPDPEFLCALAYISLHFLDSSLWDSLMLEKVVAKHDYNLNWLVALMLESPEAHAKQLLELWGNANFLVKEPILRQMYRTHLVVAITAQLPQESRANLLKTSEFVGAVSNRLSSYSDDVKSLAIYLADRLCHLAGAPPIFEDSHLADAVSAQIPELTVRRLDSSFGSDQAWEIISAPVIEETGEDTPLDLAPLSLSSEPKPTILDESDEEDDPSLAHQEKVAPPIYIRDLLAYLSLDAKEPMAYEKRKLALQVAPTLFRQKALFGSEVLFHAEDLLKILVSLSNHYEEADFEITKLNCLIAVVVSHPPVTLYLCKLLLTADYSLQQRISLLSAMSFGARALRGFKDDAVDGSFTTLQFPTKQLPAKLHALYEYDAIENQIQNLLMAEASEEANGALAKGRVVRVLARLQPETPKEVSRDRKPDFAKIVGRNFFFPLVAVWYESGGFNIGHYTPVLLAHYLRTLSLVMHTAYPAAPDLNEMAGEYLTLVTPVLQNVTTDQVPVIESIATGVLMVCETVEAVFLVTNFGGHLTVAENVISLWWESIIDERVKSLCAGLLLNIAELRKKMERVLLDQNGFYA